ncbi:hypothetical protein AB0K16_22240 [Nonomuraea jabiensis]|uniref:hypothetical protein n=1 Tax=Nonomuraea jabiensis TaxID=882448 RepID=UPI003428EB07
MAILEIDFDGEDFRLLYTSGGAGAHDAYQAPNGTNWSACYRMHSMADCLLARAYVQNMDYTSYIVRHAYDDYSFYTDYNHFKYTHKES